MRNMGKGQAAKPTHFRALGGMPKGQRPIVNDQHFTDGPRQPTLGSPSASFNPGRTAGALPKGAPKYVEVPGKRPIARGMTNKRYQSTI